MLRAQTIFLDLFSSHNLHLNLISIIITILCGKSGLPVLRVVTAYDAVETDMFMDSADPLEAGVVQVLKKVCIYCKCLIFVAE
jgi:hypothetical protein